MNIENVRTECLRVPISPQEEVCRRVACIHSAAPASREACLDYLNRVPATFVLVPTWRCTRVGLGQLTALCKAFKRIAGANAKYARRGAGFALEQPVSKVARRPGACATGLQIIDWPRWGRSPTCQFRV
jgi:hypothetical protein